MSPSASPTTDAPSTSRVRLLGERNLSSLLAQEQSQASPPSPADRSHSEVPSSPTTGHGPLFLQEVTAVLAALAMLLAARLLLLLALVFSAGLTFLTLRNPSPLALLTMSSFDLFIFAPLVFLYVKRG